MENGPDTTLHGSAEGGGDVARELHALGAQIASLQAEVRRLQGAALPRHDEAGWDDAPAASFAWLSSLEAPRRQAVRLPRLPFELAFLAGAAVLAGLARLRPLEIAAVMGGAWVIVALAEWAGSHGDRLRHRLLLEPPVAIQAADPVQADPAWFSPPVEHTMLAGARSARPGEQATVVTVPPQPATDPEATVERRPGG